MLEVGDRLLGKRSRCPTCQSALRLRPNAPPPPAECRCAGCGETFRGAARTSELLCPECTALADSAALPEEAEPPAIDLGRYSTPTAAAPRLPAPLPSSIPPSVPGAPRPTAEPVWDDEVTEPSRTSRSTPLSRVDWRVLAVAIPVLLVAVIGGFAVLRGSTSSVNPLQLVANMTLQRQLDRAIADDPRNAGIKASAYYRNAFDRSVLVFDLHEVSGERNKLDVFRVLLDFAAATTDTTCETVELAFHGKTRFQMDGDYFRTLGRDRSTENPAYTIRTFPEHLRTPSGARAFQQWTGGVLGVLAEQMKDFNEMHDQWYGSATR